MARVWVILYQYTYDKYTGKQYRCSGLDFEATLVFDDQKKVLVENKTIHH